jgi:methyl-accepting chemotaxis protein
MLRNKSIRGRLGLLFLAFVLLVSFSVGATYWSVSTQRKDALIINLAGRQRMLTQKMTWLALAQPEDPELSASIPSLIKPWMLFALGEKLWIRKATSFTCLHPQTPPYATN